MASADPSSHPHPSAPSSTTSDGSSFPRIGRTRCYWAILTPSLEFVSVDPILETHMGDQASDIIGTSFFDYAHPDEVDSLRADLLSNAGGEEGGLYGSVTRCRYSRVVRIKKLLGAKELYWAPEAKIYAIDDDYLALQVTTSWIALNPTTPTTAQQLGHAPVPKLGAVLAFFHACTDLDSVQDNDPTKGGEHEWSNWCGPKLADGPYLTPTRCARMLGALERLACPDPPPLWDDLPPVDPRHVFQVLDHTGAAVMSSPTPTEPGRALGTAGGALYYPDELAALVREITADPVRLRAQQQGATTSCTSRFRIDKTIQLAQGSVARVEGSIIIYGAVTFASFDITKLPQEQQQLILGPASMQAGVNGGGNKRALGGQGQWENEFEAKRVRLEQLSHAQAHVVQALNSPYPGPPEPNPLGWPPSSQPPPPQPSHSPYSQQVLDPALRAQGGPGGGGVPSLSINPARRFNASVSSDRDQQALSPTVASASAILGSFNTPNGGANHHDFTRTATPPAQQQQQQQQQQGYPPQSQGYAQPGINHNSNTFLHTSQAPQHPSYGPMYGQQYQLPQQTQYGYPPQQQQQQHYGQQLSSQPYAGYSQHQQQQGYGQHDQQQQQHHYYGQQPRSAGPSPSLSTQSLPAPQADSNASHSPSNTATPTAASTNDKAVPRAKSASTSSSAVPPGEVVNKPGPAACESCGTANSPEWRKGPSGTKSLCNACGLRYARQVARRNRIEKIKEENGGVMPPKKKAQKKGEKPTITTNDGVGANSGPQEGYAGQEGEGLLDPALSGFGGGGGPIEPRPPLLGGAAQRAPSPATQVPVSHPYYPQYPPVQTVVGRIYGSAEVPPGEQKEGGTSGSASNGTGGGGGGEGGQVQGGYAYGGQGLLDAGRA